MSELSTVARPYAKAAFDFALEQGQLDKWQEMLQFSAFVAENEQVAEYINSSLASGQISETFIKICGDQLDQYGQNFIRVMAENKRLAVLPMVFDTFVSLRAEHEAVKDVTIVSANELSQAQEDKIAKAMEKRLGQKVRLTNQIDNSLIAGVIIKYDDVVIDGSSRGQLNRLASALSL
ncbi:F0F1 ATP synthase subunit delta [Actinobacillus pleuropneumoniae]|uniref:ATP synthase subunit delta n=2 Tax=Actinobacillus pleuropneumoniae TaxID=715 RepID=A0ABN5MKF2_ACTPL|nr:MULTISPECIES: F0F1 ATP synthase subunit delta [Actinobacillus]ASU15498.1 ATP synthase subunit delta [Actinobacillus pleuropneumoniae]AWG96071.1 F0F1 ATP synthase subunit delta [Actinobacillus pleuropneumoniae serovar 1 str. 4074]AXA22141.1 F0F1 ATP synthase subunit delta [Actinobacillus pleuropneumoniae]EFL81109.1 F0F1 ATP synthase subunit delta [Actinobacillus pleuropneumoniae serovar 6 str. Femo]EFM89102.1 ATP synthase F1 [Actinobacillus pleuropneumoniae serovar 4 str. M62]